MKMKERNAQLKMALGAMASKERVQEVASIPDENTVNRQGFKAYSLADELRLLSMLNTLKIADQYYRSEDEILVELRDLIERIGLKDPYFLAQCIVYSRCCGEGMRSINQLAATLAAPFVAGQPWAKAFYSLWDKKRKMGGCIYRVDDMEAIKDAYVALNSAKLSNAMKKGFANALENLDTYQLAKYKKACIDLANLVHPNSALSKAVVNIDGEEMKTLDALMKGITVSADTWEVAQSEAGQEVAKAVKEGKITKEEGEKVLAEAKNDNWESLLMEGRLGILAALRNIRNMLKNPRVEVIDKLCELVSDGDKIRDGLIMPYHLDIAHVIIETEFANCEFGDMVKQALRKGYEMAMPNLKALLTGKTCVMVDVSGSMSSRCSDGKNINKSYARRAISEAALVGATIAKACGGDVVLFSDRASYFTFRKSDNVFAIAKQIESAAMWGGTSIGSAFELIRRDHKSYDRIFVLSDNECNMSSGWYSKDWVKDSYKKYVHDVCSPYVYCVDLCAYGTTILPQTDKIAYYFGYGYSMIEDVAKLEFNPEAHIDKVRKIVIDPSYQPEYIKESA